MITPTPEDVRVIAKLRQLALEEEASADTAGFLAEKAQYECFDQLTQRDKARRRASDYRTAALRLENPLQVISETVASVMNGEQGIADGDNSDYREPPKASVLDRKAW